MLLQYSNSKPNKLTLRLFYYLFFLVSTNIFSQNIQGILYDSEGVVSNFEIWNKTQQLAEKTDERGYFQIEAEIGDSIIFNSMAYEKHILLALPKHFDEQIVVDLKRDINNLNQINLTGFKKEFDPKKYNKNFGAIIKKDREDHPYQYEKLNPQGNFLALFGIIYQQFFKKKPSEKIVVKITFDDFKKLFETDNLINERFLKEELKIPGELKNLFFDYLDSLSWNAELLLQENKMNLMQNLYDSSSEYLQSIRSNDVYK